MPQLRIAAILLAGVCLFNQTGIDAVGAGRPHLDSLARVAKDQNRSSRVIVRYRSGAGPKMRTLVASGQKLRDLAANPDVVGISTDAVIHAHGESGSRRALLLAALDTQQLRRTLGLSPAASGGRGVGVAVIDSGISPMPDIVARITAFYDFTAGGIATVPTDEYGHGTHVAGLIAGSGAMSLGAHRGIAPGARLIGLKVLDAAGSGYTSDVIAAIDFATANRRQLGVDIINLSLGHPILESAATDPLVQAVERASAAGIVVVTSAGNAGESREHGPGFGGISSPGNAPSALTVGAFDTQGTVDRGDDSIPTFSSRGPTWFDGAIKPDVLAPGVGLMAASNPASTLARNARVTKPYLALSGTSMASAVASGVVALMIEANRLDNPYTRLTPNTVKMLLQYSALPVAEAASTIELTEGAGGINAMGALALARAIDPSTRINEHWLERGVEAASRIGATLVSWTRRVTWGDRLVTGDVLNRHELAWSARAVWGETLPWSPDTWLTESIVLANFDMWSTLVVKSSTPVRAQGADHIVWGNAAEDSAVFSNCSSAHDHVVWGNCGADHIV